MPTCCHIGDIEHERFARDLLELKWHISFESRQLKYIKDEVDILMDANNEYQVQKTDNMQWSPLYSQL